MTMVATTHDPKTRRCPDTSRQSGTNKASCGLNAIALSTSPATTGRSCSANHQQAATAATTRATGWPTITPKATGKTPSKIAGSEKQGGPHEERRGERQHGQRGHEPDEWRRVQERRPVETRTQTFDGLLLCGQVVEVAVTLVQPGKRRSVHQSKVVAHAVLRDVRHDGEVDIGADQQQPAPQTGDRPEPGSGADVRIESERPDHVHEKVRAPIRIGARMAGLRA